MPLRKGIILLLYILTAGVVLIGFLFHPGINGYERAMFGDMVGGTAYRPFAYRMLVPATIRLLSNIAPNAIKSAVVQMEGERRIFHTLGWESQLLFEYTVAVVLMFGCFVGLAIVLRTLISRFYSFPSFIADLAPIIALIILPAFFRYYNYIYDPATLLLSSLAIACLASQRLLWFYFIFLLATLNKETSVLLIGIFFVAHRSAMNRTLLARHLSLLALLWGSTKVLITYAFRDNRGSFVEIHLNHNLALFSNVPALGGLLAVFVLGGILIRHRWKEKPLFLREGFLTVLLPLVVLSAFLGYIDETRGYYEAYPFAFLLVVPTLVDVLSDQR